ncbi:MAG: DUF4167 domain-containing protein [Rhizobiales bacterium]|nr:DUF4167 domain-containing protein [Hyphomicrobiales bacterium]
MRQGQQNNRRGRHNNNNSNRRNNNSNSSKSQNMLTKSFDSNGPDVKIRGNAATVAEKYMSLAHDAISAGSRIKAENYFQHAEHYKRIVATATQQQAEQRAAHDAKQAEQRAAHEAKQAEQRAAHEARQAARAEQRETHANAEPIAADSQPDLEMAPENIIEDAPSMTNNNNMPVDILSNNEVIEVAAPPVIETPVTETPVIETPVTETEHKPKRPRPKRKPVAKKPVASTTPVNVDEAKNIDEAKPDLEPSEISEKPKKPVRKPRAKVRKPKDDSKTADDTVTENSDV